MRRLLPTILTALAVVAVPQIVAAEEGGRPERPGPKKLFQRLDANQDGVITADEVSEEAPEWVKRAVVKADRNNDKELTTAEWEQAVEERRAARSKTPKGDWERRRHHGGPPGADGERRRHHDGPPGADGERRRHRDGPPGGDWERRRHDGPPGGDWDRRRHHDGPPSGDWDRRRHHGGPPRGYQEKGRYGGPHQRRSPPHAGRPPRLPDPEKLFARLDQDDNEQLSLEEFSQGMERLHQRMAMHRPHRPHGDGDQMHRPRRPQGPHGEGAHHRPGEHGRKMFERADANQDGKVELAEVPEERRERFERLLARADKDGDNALSIEEAKAARPRGPMAGGRGREAKAWHGEKMKPRKPRSGMAAEGKPARKFESLEARLEALERELDELKKAE